MGTKLDLNLIQSLNLFSKISQVRTKYCFRYNNWLVFVVPPGLISRALGEKGKNVYRLSKLLKCKVKVIPAVGLEPFVKAIVYPVKFKKLTEENNEVIIVSGPNSKAALLGRGKIRLEELSRILKDYFGIKSLRIV